MAFLLIFLYCCGIVNNLYFNLYQGVFIMKTKMLLAVVLLAVGTAAIAAEPVLRAGIITDTHVTRKKQSCNLLREALKLFKTHKVDLVINVGDIADQYYEEGYKHYRNTVNEIYSDSNKPQEIFVYANHDIIGRKKESPFEVFKDVKKHLQIPNDPYDVVKLKGYTFVIFPQFYRKGKYKKMMDAAVKENAGKPVFVIDHVPPANTVFDSAVWGSGSTRELMDKYPSAIHISGHVHGSLTNELNIWQGNFTAVNAGGLAYWHGAVTGNTPSEHKSDMAMIMEVYTDKVVFRRFFTTTKQEYQADTPWCVPLPFAPETAPYNHAVLKEKSTAPEFSADAKAVAAQAKRGVKVTFPSAVHKDGVFNYKMELFTKIDGSWKLFARQDITGDFMIPADKRPKSTSHVFNWGFFDNGKEYRAVIAPVHFFGKTGKSVSVDFSVSSKPESIVVYECKDPMKELAYLSGLEKGTAFKLDANGFYDVNRSKINTRLEFPKGVWEGKKGTKFRFTVDVAFKQDPKSPWTIVLRNPVPLKNATNRISSVTGDAGSLRYVMEFAKHRADFFYYLLIREGGKGKVKFNYIKIERLQ